MIIALRIILARLIRAHLALPLDPVLEVHDESLGQEDGGRARPEAGRPQPLGQAARVGEVGGHAGVVAEGSSAELLEDAVLRLNHLQFSFG